MDWIQAIVLGLVQGLTEFLPISSSAHVSIVGQLLFDGRDPGAAFTAVTQLGTETAVLVYFRKDIWRIITHWFGSFTGKVAEGDPDARMGWLIIIGTLPIAEALVAKGVGLGTALAFMMAVTALSLPSLIMLKKVIKAPLLALFFTIVVVGIVLIGYLFNAFAYLFI